MPEVTAAIVNWNSGPMLGQAVESLLETSNVDVLVVDNASTDGSLDQLPHDPARVRVVRNLVNCGFAGAINQAFAETEAPLVLILNPDVRARGGAVDRLREVFRQAPRAGAAGGFVNGRYFPRPFPTLPGLVLENLGFPPRRLAPAGQAAVRVDQPAAAALMIRRTAFDAVGGFDPRFHPAWYEDVDFCRMMADAGWDAYFDPGAVFEHTGGYSMHALGREGFLRAYYRNQFRYAGKHLKPGAVPILKSALAMGLAARAIVRPGGAGAAWRAFRDLAGA